MSKIQTACTYHPDDGYSFIIGFHNGPAMTLSGLTEGDIYEIASCSVCTLPESVSSTLLKPTQNLK